ncbi:SDR family oxidoreductase [Brenneria tiliae]|uniref:SDR family oxidoreductase n=1 Tax=Brenneria tiliae TaxID=2914984 RepID=A0ABT0N043_9GAMM|nr:SDR family oxidoreductase [Brenneria tiliae]MCL2895466.1 SDR family oxidoreductase [Brenneria tiliae]
MKKVAIIGLGWLGMPLAWALNGHGYQVVGSKTTIDGVEAARLSGIECYQLRLTPELECDAEELKALLQVDALVITLPASRTAQGGESYARAVQTLVNTARVFNVPRIIFTSSTSVYGDSAGTVRENSPLRPVSVAGKVLASLEQWLRHLPDTSVDILRLAGLVGIDRHPGRFLAGKTGLSGGSHGVNLVHQEDVLEAIQLLLKLPHGGHLYNLCAPGHPAKRRYYADRARQLGLTPPQFVAGEEDTSGRIVDGQRICRELGFDYLYPDPMLMPLN